MMSKMVPKFIVISYLRMEAFNFSKSFLFYRVTVLVLRGALINSRGVGHLDV
jgi:hypothetical protein